MASTADRPQKLQARSKTPILEPKTRVAEMLLFLAYLKYGWRFRHSERIVASWAEAQPV